MSQNNENMNDNNIYKFLEERSVQNGHTHTSMCNPKGCYLIEDHDLDLFYEYYEKALFKGELHITEKHNEISPMIIDLDFKYELETFERKHKISHVEKIINMYVGEICNLFEIENNDQRLTSFVFERDELYKIKGITKDGIHILFPNIVSYPDAQYYIRNNVLKKIGEIIGDLGLKNVISDVVDKSVITPNTCWLLYGSNKDRPKGNPYRLKYIFDGNVNLISPEDYFGEEPVNLARFFSIRGRKISDLLPIRSDKLDLLKALNKKKTVKAKNSSYLNYDIEQIRSLVSILSDERVENYSQWIEVGWMLHNIDPLNDELLEIWINFSKKSKKFVEGECEKLWDNMKSEGLTIATLHYWAKIDNYAKYNELKNKDINKHIETSIKTQSNYDIAFVLHKMFEYDFVYSENEWYMFKNHFWHKESDGMSLRQKISTELHDKYAKLMSYYNQVAAGKILIDNHELTEEEKEEYKKKNLVVLDLTKKLKTTSFKDNVMRECKELFSKDNRDFVRKLDENPHLLGFNNGVYDLQKDELRDGRPDDYISISTGIDKIDFDDCNEHWEDLQQFLNTVFVDEEIREYFLIYLSSCLQGHNAEEKFRFWTGIGCHAIDTPIMMSDGTIKNVQDIILGDKLMGDDYTERNVIELKNGFSTMVKFYGKGFESFTVNTDHILCLIYKNNLNNSYEISVKDFLKLSDKDNYQFYDSKNNCYEFMYDTNISKADFYGFELDNNHRYIMGNGLVTHNSNGKSKILELFRDSLGSDSGYAIKLPVTLFTGKRAASNACTPEILQSKGKRFGFVEEPGGKDGPGGPEKINAGLLKEFTGGDKIKARGLHKDPIEFKPQFKLALLCNDLPEAPPNDTGYWRRMEVIEFKSHFCQNPKEPHEFPIDNQLSLKIKNWKELFMALLLDVYYVKYKKNGIKVPLEVVKYTLQYQKDCDQYSDFISENLAETNNNNDIIIINEMYEEFKTWYQETFGNVKFPTKKEFKLYLKKKYGKKMTVNELKGFKFRIKYEKSNGIVEVVVMSGF
jgi:phage/plasmid-associated DNA primase